MPITVNGISCNLAGGVRETTQTTGTGTYSLDGAATVEGITYRTFVAGVGTTLPTVYTVRSGAQFETGIGTATAGAPATLTRSTILESSNSNNAVSWGAGVKDIFCDAAAGALHSLQSQLDTIPVTRIKTTVFTSNDTLTTDAACLFAWVRIVGGGGAGGGCTSSVGGSNHRAGGGGGAGEYAEAYFTVVQLGASKAVTIGAGGTGVSGANGNDGGTTNFGGGLLTALGGSGGAVGVEPTSGFATAAGGSGAGGGAGGFLRIPGGDGVNGMVRETLNLQTGIGGNSVLGPVSRALHGTGNPGNSYGGGGAGAVIGANEAAIAGGAGAAGVCIVVEYLHP